MSFVDAYDGAPYTFRTTGQLEAGNAVRLITRPTITGPATTYVENTITLSATATTIFPSQVITKYRWKLPNGTVKETDTHEYTFAVYGIVGEYTTIECVAVDNLGNYSLPGKHKIKINNFLPFNQTFTQSTILQIPSEVTKIILSGKGQNGIPEIPAIPTFIASLISSVPPSTITRPSPNLGVNYLSTDTNLDKLYRTTLPISYTPPTVDFKLTGNPPYSTSQLDQTHFTIKETQSSNEFLYQVSLTSQGSVIPKTIGASSTATISGTSYTFSGGDGGIPSSTIHEVLLSNTETVDLVLNIPIGAEISVQY